MRVIATAGHVDHGKSALLRALTGMEPDRWAEEQRRGMTIDLGYAWTRLPSGEQLAFVDVPGHRRFVPNMLAGVGPVPAVLFVVAADGGWMPQSAEHLAVIDALGISEGVIAVTRADLADPGPARAQAADRISRSGLGRVPAVAVSSVTGAGLAELTGALRDLAGGLPVPDPGAPVRIWVDRAFSISGSGTVVTGTLQADTVSQGDELLLTPSLRPVRVRGLQALGESAATLAGVARIAVNLRGVSRSDVSRGMALVQPGRWTMASQVDVRITAGRGRLPRLVSMHVGAARSRASVRTLGDRHARLTLGEILPLRVADRILLRDPGASAPPGLPPGAAGGIWWPGLFGATVLDVAPQPLTRRGAAAALAAELASWPGPPGERTATGLGGTGIAGPERADSELAGLAPPAADAVTSLLRDLAARPFHAPDAGRLQDLGLGKRELAVAARTGALLRLGGQIVLAPGADIRAAQILGRLDQPFSAAAAREALGSTRRTVIPLLEHLDRLMITRRLPDDRRVMRDAAGS